jgi:DNA-directed RNA polymerase I, II, and III subunit RPABC2
MSDNEEEPEDLDDAFDSGDEQMEDDDVEVIQDEMEAKKGTKIADDDRSSVPFLTKYERARILGTRALQISKNADLLVDPSGETDPYKIAEMELQERKIPFIIRRYMPDGSYEDWKLGELTIE